MTTSALPIDARKNRWLLALLILAFLWSTISFLYQDTFLSMVEIWERSETFTHCFLVFPIVLWLVWRKKGEILNHLPDPNFWVLIPFSLFGIFWLMGSITATNSVSQFSFVGLLVCSVVLVVGTSIARIIIFPLGFLFFAVPIGEFLLPTLMEWTANFTIFALRLTGIPVYRDGLQFVIPSGNWSVVEACSGVRYLIASLTVGTLFAYLNYTSNQRRLFFIVVSIIVPVFANWVRAYMIVLLGHLSGNTIAVGVDHIIYGWVFFGIVIISMFMIGIRWAETPTVMQVTHSSLLKADAIKTRYGFYLCVSLVLGVFFSILPVHLSEEINSSQESSAIELIAPKGFGGNWLLVDGSSDIWMPNYQKPDAQISHIYENSSSKVGLYIAYYKNQKSDRKLISSDNVIVSSEDSRWSTVYQDKTEINLDNISFDIKSTTLRHKNGVAGASDLQMEVWRYYWIAGYVTDNDYVAKIYTAISKILGHGDDGAVIVLHVLRRPGVDSKAVLGEFLRDNYFQIDELLHTARKGGVASVNTIGKM